MASLLTRFVGLINMKELLWKANLRFVALTLLFTSLLAQVIANHGPEGGSITARGIAIDPVNANTLYVGTLDGGLFKSTDGGKSWVFKAFNDLTVVTIAISSSDPSIIYADPGGGILGIFKSTDGGSSWNPTSLTPAGSPTVDPDNPDIIYALVSEGVAKSTNGGDIWTITRLEDADPTTLVIDPVNTSTIYVGTANSRRGIYKSSDAGQNWTRYDIWKPTNPRILSMVIDPQNTDILYAGGFEGVFKSMDGGESWTELDRSLSVGNIAIDPSDTRILYLRTTAATGIYKSTDGGESWMFIENDLRVTALAIDISETNTIYLGTSGFGVFKSTDAGQSWEWSNTGLSATEIRALAIAPSDTSRLYASVYLAGFSKSSDAGEAWTPIRQPYWFEAIAVDPSNADILYGGTNGDNLGLMKSVDGGDSWSTVLEQASSAVVIDPTAPDIVYALVPFGLRSEIYKSLNAGEEWTRIADLPGVSFTMTIDPINTNVLYLGFRQQGIYKSTDGGQTWRSSGLLGFSVLSISIDPSDSRNLYAATDAGIYKSTDGGVNWTALPQAATTILVDPNNGNTLYAGNADGVFKSTDGGHTWEQRNDGLTNTVIRQLAIAPDTGRIYAGTLGGGVWFSDDQAETWQ